VGTVTAVAALWAAFMLTHIVLSSVTVRPRLVGALGEQSFLGLYSLVALATFVPLVWVFATGKHDGPLLWTTLGPAEVARALNWVLMLAAFVLLVSSFVPSSTPPSAMQARGPMEAHGIIRVTRHPMLVAFACFGLAHLLVNGSLASVVFFAGFPLFTWIGSRHQDARKLHERSGYDAVLAETSVLPFAAILAGRQRLVLSELPWVAIAIGVVATVLVRRWHHVLFGGGA
jgi:uncharacterized membrane protein